MKMIFVYAIFSLYIYIMYAVFSLYIYIMHRNRRLNLTLKICVCVCMGFPSVSGVKNLPVNVGDVSLILALRRSLGGGNGNPLLYSGLENPMERGAWQAAVHGAAK